MIFNPRCLHVLILLLLLLGSTGCRQRRIRAMQERVTLGTVTLAIAYADMLEEASWEARRIGKKEAPSGMSPATYVCVTGTLRGTSTLLQVYFANEAEVGEIAWYTVNDVYRDPATYDAFVSDYYLCRHLAGNVVKTASPAGPEASSAD